MPGALAHPQPRGAIKKAHRVSHRRFAGAFRHSPRGKVLTAYSTLSLVNRACCHHPRSRCEAIVTKLTPASGRQDHMASPSATARSSCAAASTASSAPRLVTIAKRPSWWAEDARTIAVICPSSQAERSAAHWHDGQISLTCPKSVKPRSSFRGARKREPGIHNAARMLGEMDSGQPLRGFRNDGNRNHGRPLQPCSMKPGRCFNRSK